MDVSLLLPWLSLLVGLAARIFVPWLAKRQKDADASQFEWSYVWPQLLSVVLILAVLPLVVSDLSLVSNLPYQAAWLLGWAAGDIGRQTYKVMARDEG